jgi:hypothetical protein
MNVKERLRKFIKHKEISERRFCQKIGVSSTYVNSIRKSIQPDKLKNITEQYPELNPIWLITGNGEMTQPTNTNHISGSGNMAVAGNGNKVTHNDIAELIELQKGYQNMLRDKDEQINRLISVIEKLSEK